MIFEVLSWDGAVGEGVNEAEFCTLGAIAKFNNPKSPYLVANEYIAARLAHLLGLPVPPVALVRSPQADTGIVSLRVGAKGETPPPVIPAEIAADHPELTAATVVFDSWIANDDRHKWNVAYSRAGNTAPFLFDHDRCLLGATLGADRLTERVTTPCQRHCLGGHVIVQRLLDRTVLEIQALSTTMIANVCRDAVAEHVIGSAKADAVVQFLLARRPTLAQLVHALTPQIKQGPLL